MKEVILSIFGLVVLASNAFCQNTQQLTGQISQLYTNSEASRGSLISGFSAGGLIGGLLFGGIGFVAFIYGKKNAEFRPMVIGVLLMVYPYFIRTTLALYLVGIGLSIILFVFRE